MTSAVDITFPVDNVEVSKADFRAQMLVIRDEISALQDRTDVAGREAFLDNVTTGDVLNIIVANARVDSIGKDIAFDRITF